MTAWGGKPSRPVPVRVSQTVENALSMMTACMEELREAGFAVTADMVLMARVDLLVRIHGVSEAELDQLIEAIATARKPD